MDPVDSVTLTGVVRQALGDHRTEVLTWQRDPIPVPVGSAFTAGLSRVRGTAESGGRRLPWSAVLKIVHRPPGTTAYDQPGGTPYWRREACVYESGLLADLGGGLSAPRCFAVVPQHDETVALWLEDVTDHHDEGWPLPLYYSVARHLGQFNGAYLAGRPLPAAPWLATEPLRAWVTSQTGSVDLIDRPGIWSHPLLRQAFPVAIAGRLRRLWAERETFLEALRRLPQTFCHFDAGHHNLLPQPADGGSGRTVALDWECAGIAAVGEEIGLLISSPFIRNAHHPSAIPRIRELVFEGYLDGLRDAGWHGPCRDVRLGFAANAALRFVFRTTGLRDVIDESRQAREEQHWGCSFETLMEGRAALTYALLDLVDEARALME
ncbi:MAG: hypothetical protein AB7R89_29390 [Dehalococcoidia bacterium]